MLFRSLTIAEESTAWPGVTASVESGGLGFHFKWNMGWMHDTLRYLGHESIHRPWHHGDMTFGMVYAWSEAFVLPLSHDEVVHGKGSMIGKAPGDDWQRFANLRAYYGFMWTHPGKKLLFMGGEFAQWREWNHDDELDWALLDQPAHRGVHSLVRDLNRLYRDLPALHAMDHRPEGFQWIVGDDHQNSVFAYLRRAGPDSKDVVLAVVNMTPVPRHGYRLGVPFAGVWEECLNTDAEIYGGSNLGNGGRVQADEILGPVFAAKISDWEPHLQKMFGFWSSVALMSGAYHGQPMAKHLPLPVDARHFDRWLALFEATARDICPPKAAEHITVLARRIAESQIGRAHV